MVIFLSLMLKALGQIKLWSASFSLCDKAVEICAQGRVVKGPVSNVGVLGIGVPLLIRQLARD